MRNLILAACATIGTALATPASAVVLDYDFTVANGGTFASGGSFSIDFTGGVYSLVGLDLTVGSTNFNLSNSGLVNFGQVANLGEVLLIGGNVSGVTGTNLLNDDFFLQVGATGSSLSAISFFAIRDGSSVQAAGILGGGTNFVITPSVAAAVPEPATWAMLLLGFGAIGISVRRKRPAATP